MFAGGGVVEIPITTTGRVYGAMAGARGGDSVSYSGGASRVFSFEMEVTEGDTFIVILGEPGSPATDSEFGGGGGGASALIHLPSTAANVDARLILLAGGGRGALKNGNGGDPNLIFVETYGSSLGAPMSSETADFLGGGGGARDQTGYSSSNGGQGGSQSAFFGPGAGPGASPPAAPLVQTGLFTLVSGGPGATGGGGSGGSGFCGGGGGGSDDLYSGGGGGGWNGLVSLAGHTSVFRDLVNNATAGRFSTGASIDQVIQEATRKRAGSSGFISLSGGGTGDSLVFMAE